MSDLGEYEKKLINIETKNMNKYLPIVPPRLHAAALPNYGEIMFINNVSLDEEPAEAAIQENSDQLKQTQQDLDSEESMDMKGVPSPTEIEMSAMLACDIAETKKIDIQSMINLQIADKLIQKIRERIRCDKDSEKYFTLRGGLVCRTYTLRKDNSRIIGMYVPCLLYTSDAADE